MAEKFWEVLANPISCFLILGQSCFFLRFFVQWRVSEKKSESTIPLTFWFFSLGGASLTLIYFIYRRDLILALAQVMGLGIYLRNLNLIYNQRLRTLLFSFLGIGLALALGMGIFGQSPFSAESQVMLSKFFGEFTERLKHPVAIFGITGQLIFSTRFILQWIASERKSESTFPVAFWLVSITGSLLTLVYVIGRFEFILVLAQLFGLFIYSRNLYFVRCKRKQTKA